MASEREINAVIFGGRGSGRSTFIKMLEIVVLHPSLKDAEAFDLSSCKLAHHTSMTLDPHETNQCKDERRNCKPQVFQWRTKYGILRLIETPSLKEGSSVDYDNFECHTSFVESFKSIHAIILVLRMDNDNLNMHVQQYLSQVLFCLGKDALRKVMFVFTHTKHATNRERVAKQLQNTIRIFGSQIDISGEMCFCFENGSLEYLIQRPAAKAHFSRTDLVKFDESYKKTVREYMKLVCKLLECTEPYSCAGIQVIRRGKKLLAVVIQLVSVLENKVADLQELVNHKLKKIEDIASQVNAVIPEVQCGVRRPKNYANTNMDLQNVHANEHGTRPRGGSSAGRPPGATFARSISRGAVMGAFKGATQAGFYGAFFGAFEGAAIGAGWGSLDVVSSVIYSKMFASNGQNFQALDQPTDLIRNGEEVTEDEAIFTASQQNAGNQLEELQQERLAEEKQLDTLYEICGELNSELELLANFNEAFNTLLSDFCTAHASADEYITGLHTNERLVPTAEDLVQRIDKLYKLKHVGSSLTQAVIERHTCNTVGFETVDMTDGYLFDRVVKRYAVMTRLVLKGHSYSI